VARGARLFREIDKNADGRISRAEFTVWVKQNAAEFKAIAGKRTSDQVFEDLDKSKKGYFTLTDAGCAAATSVGK
jgi:Ca2+-binding EF-hand superfamily protein